jgi:hypothetical protein
MGTKNRRFVATGRRPIPGAAVGPRAHRRRTKLEAGAGILEGGLPTEARLEQTAARPRQGYGGQPSRESRAKVGSWKLEAGCGFSLIELLVATSITVIVVLLACTMAVQAQYAWRADGARVDLQQRARVAADVLTRALFEAGAGPPAGHARGSLAHYLPSVVPRRAGRRNADAPTVARADAFTTLRAAHDMEQAVLQFAAAAGTSTVDIAGDPSCDLPACGFVRGTNVVMFDESGNHDVFTVTDVAGQSLSLRHHGSGAHPGYPAGTPVIAVDVFTYAVDRTARILRSYDGDASDLPLVDDMVEMEVEYYGEPRPPSQPRPAIGVANCLYENDGSFRAVLFPSLPASGVSQVRLAAEALADGPWCGTGENRFDADLLRLRRVRLTLRLQAGDPAARGSDAGRFRAPGFAHASSAEVPDVTVVVDVTPRNLPAPW